MLKSDAWNSCKNEMLFIFAMRGCGDKQQRACGSRIAAHHYMWGVGLAWSKWGWGWGGIKTARFVERTESITGIPGSDEETVASVSAT